MPKSIEKQRVRLAPIETECHFVEVCCEMLRAYLVPRSHDATFEQREGVFDGVGMNISSNADVLFLRVIHTLVPEIPDRAFVGLPFVSNEYVHVSTDVLLDVLRQCSRLGIGGMKEAQFAIALPNADYDFLASVGSFFPPSLTVTAQLSANEGFVHFDGAIQHRLFSFLHGRSDTMAEVPCGLVADSEFPLHLIRRMPFARFAEQQRGEEPFLQGKVRVVEDRSRCDSKLVITRLAVEQLLLSSKLSDWSAAAQALDSIRPAQTYKQLAALGIGIKQIDYIN